MDNLSMVILKIKRKKLYFDSNNILEYKKWYDHFQFKIDSWKYKF